MPETDPEIKSICEWRRTGRHASFSFRCELFNQNSTDRTPKVFELTLSDLLANPRYRELLARTGFVVQDRIAEYSDEEGESAYRVDASHRGTWHRFRKRSHRSAML